MSQAESLSQATETPLGSLLVGIRGELGNDLEPFASPENDPVYGDYQREGASFHNPDYYATIHVAWPTEEAVVFLEGSGTKPRIVVEIESEHALQVPVQNTYWEGKKLTFFIIEGIAFRAQRQPDVSGQPSVQFVPIGPAGDQKLADIMRVVPLANEHTNEPL